MTMNRREADKERLLRMLRDHPKGLRISDMHDLSVTYGFDTWSYGGYWTFGVFSDTWHPERHYADGLANALAALLREKRVATNGSGRVVIAEEGE